MKKGPRAQINSDCQNYPECALALIKEGSLGSVALPRLSGAPARIDKAVLQG